MSRGNARLASVVKLIFPVPPPRNVSRPNVRLGPHEGSTPRPEDDSPPIGQLAFPARSHTARVLCRYQRQDRTRNPICKPTTSSMKSLGTGSQTCHSEYLSILPLIALLSAVPIASASPRGPVSPAQEELVMVSMAADSAYALFTGDEGGAETLRGESNCIGSTASCIASPPEIESFALDPDDWYYVVAWGR